MNMLRSQIAGDQRRVDRKSKYRKKMLIKPLGSNLLNLILDYPYLEIRFIDLYHYKL